MAFVMLRLKRQGLTFHVRRQQCRRIFGRCTPRTIRIAAFLVVKNYVAADFPPASSILRSMPGRSFIFPSQTPVNEDFA